MLGLRSKTLKRLLIALGGLLVIAILALAIACVSIAASIPNPSWSVRASDALGMQVTIGGGLKVRLFPSIGVTLQDVRIRSQGTEWVAAQEAKMGIDLMPLLRRQIRISWIGLHARHADR